MRPLNSSEPITNRGINSTYVPGHISFDAQVPRSNLGERPAPGWRIRLIAERRGPPRAVGFESHSLRLYALGVLLAAFSRVSRTNSETVFPRSDAARSISAQDSSSMRK